MSWRELLKAGSVPPVLLGGIAAAGAGRVWLQDFGGAVPLLGAGCVRRRADPGGRFPFHGFQGGRFCRAGAGAAGGLSRSRSPFWTVVIAVLATASMIVGNVLALAQRNIKRLLAYSSIAQAGYILIGVAAGNAAWARPGRCITWLLTW